MSSRFCKNPFIAHPYRRNNIVKVSENLVKKWNPILQSGDLLCISCKRFAYKHDPQSRNDNLDEQDIPTVNRAYEEEEEEEQQQNISNVSEEKENVSDSSSAEMEVDLNESFNSSMSASELFVPSRTDNRELILPVLNELLSLFKIENIDSIDLEIPRIVESKIDNLSKLLKSSLIKNYEVKNEDNFDPELLREIREKFKNSTNVSEKKLLLTVLPLSWSCRKMETTTGCSFYQAQQSKRLHEKKGILSKAFVQMRNDSLNTETIRKVQSFYCEDEISRMCPGQKDYITIKEAESSIKVQKRLLLHNLKEIYALFKIQYPDEKIGFSKFCEFRPQQCVLVNDLQGAHNVCVCVYHQNVKLMLEGAKLSTLINNKELNVLITYKDILNNILCKIPKEECIYQTCKECPGFQNTYEQLKTTFECNLISNISYKEWKNVNSRWELTTKECNTSDYLEELKNKFLDKFVQHDFLAKSQSDFIKTRKKNLENTEVMVLMDFSENYTCIIQDAIQSHHWNCKQVTIHPFAIYKKVNNEVEEESFVVISENLNHDVFAVSLFQEKLIEYLKLKYKDTIKKVLYVSDGAGSQYKNKSNFLNLVQHYKKFNIEAEWHFFATSHGKSACDGIGGTIKRLARRASLQGKDITTPKELYLWAKSALPNISFTFCTEKEHVDNKNKLKPILDEAKTIKGTLSYHSFVPVNKNNEKEIIVRRFSESAKCEKKIII